MSFIVKIGFGFLSILFIMPAYAGVFVYSSPSYYDVESDRVGSVSNGIYFSGEKFEAAYEKTELELKNNIFINQEDSSLVWKFNVKQTLLRLGLHYASSDEAESNNKKTFILEVLHYSKDVFGNSIYFTLYSNNAVVWQLSSRFGRYYTPSFLPGTLYLQAQAEAILINTITTDDSYFNLDLNAHLQVNSWWGLELGGWFGEKRSAVSGSGFVVYNLNDVYLGEARFRTTVNLSKNFSLKFGAQINQRESGLTKEIHNVSSFLGGMNYAF
ncbi:MAG: hypothetical protein ACC653_13290 [Gammaproteobacteria bacterium]